MVRLKADPTDATRRTLARPTYADPTDATRRTLALPIYCSDLRPITRLLITSLYPAANTGAVRLQPDLPSESRS